MTSLLVVRHGDWLRCYRPRPRVSYRLICLPPAGGAASFYRTWAGELPATVELWAVQYPGREDRFTEPGAPDLVTLADSIAAAVQPIADRPLVVFGHSMGASVAYEVTRRLQASHPGAVVRLCVSGRPAPVHQRTRRSELYSADDDIVLAELQLLGGTDPKVFEHAELRELLLPMIRNDFRMIETYRPDVAEPLEVPIVALTGDVDPRMTVSEASGWAGETTSTYRLEVFAGGHFYLVPHRHAVIEEVLRDLTPEGEHMEIPFELTLEGIRAAVAQLLDVDPYQIGDEDNLLAVGVDSIKLMTLASVWQTLGVDVPFVDLAEEPTLNRWSRLTAQSFLACRTGGQAPTVG